ncbi:excinuclease ABC subunit UvrC [Arcanobacterium hippocoleae]|uniref:UvrABC system protein C n=1 Tax=Arcanobacterium hippocoleae TaxID=149017 RepID=A0ABU1T0D9_9ACTO|nr:excinuclease ABC subunit UvrC [Arcanobacterium hippocoleae]MDR6938800.1 excinuclease ABC subunit C [Arcanobacterium hippocoleae]
MADPQSYRPKTSDIPADPGVYRFLDHDGRIIYVGKAKNLRNRLTSYFRDPAQLHPRTRQMVFTGERVIWVVVKSELEALTLEYAWIKEYNPIFNVMYRDDKSYPYLAITAGEEYPRLTVTRDAHRKGNKYYGPYTQVRAVRESVDLLQRVFPMRTCTKGVFNAAARAGRPCLNGYIEKCVAPCVGRVSANEHRNIVESLVKYLESDGAELIAEKRAEMTAAATKLDFETAAKIRDQISALETVTEKNTVVLDANVDADIYGISADELEASVQVFYVRGGRIRGQRGWITEISGDSTAQLLADLLLQVYGAFATPKNKNSAEVIRQQKIKSDAKSVDDVAHTAVNAIPREIWLPQLPDGSSELTQWLAELRRGAVTIRTPQRGAKAKLLDTVEVNAKQALTRHKISRSGDITQRSQALEELRIGLDLPRAPLRIECYDISHIQGQHQVASMVVFEDGLAKKKDYRHFIVRGEDGNGARDDTAAMSEVLRRRLTRLTSSDLLESVTVAGDSVQPRDSENKTANLCETDNSAVAAESGAATLAAAIAQTRQKPRFAYRPDLIVVDGGLPQVNAAQAVVDEMKADVTVVGLAKRLEEIWIPGENYPLILSRNSPALHLLQYLRDESHRFAITFHRKRRGKAQTVSILDEIPGLGAAKQKALLRKFKSVKQIRAASIEDLQLADGIGPALARTIREYFDQL